MRIRRLGIQPFTASARINRSIPFAAVHAEAGVHARRLHIFECDSMFLHGCSFC